MRSAGGEARRLVAVGGGTRGGLWTQIVSDVLGRPQVLPSVTVGACYGDALLAARATGVDTGGWNPPVGVIEPDAAAGETYATLYRPVPRPLPGDPRRRARARGAVARQALSRPARPRRAGRPPAQ